MRRSVAVDVAALNRVRLAVQAGIEDHPILVPLLHEAKDSGLPGRATDGPTGKGGHWDLSDRLRYTPDGDLMPFRDPAEEALAELGEAIQLLLRGSAILRRVATTNLEHPASANYCRGGVCPDGKMAERGKSGRCSACSAFWYAVHNPEARREREYVGQPRPRPDGLPGPEVDSVSRIAC